MENLSPANKGAEERKRIPMSVPLQRLETPEIPGYHLHWFRGTAERIQRALDGGYEYVDSNELRLNSVGLGNASAISGNTDMGSRVSVVSDSEAGRDGQPGRLILMKIKQEWFEEDQRNIAARSEKTAASLRGGLLGSEQDAQGDTKQRYVDNKRTSVPDFFTPKAAR